MANILFVFHSTYKRNNQYQVCFVFYISVTQKKILQLQKLIIRINRKLLSDKLICSKASYSKNSFCSTPYVHRVYSIPINDTLFQNPIINIVGKFCCPQSSTKSFRSLL